MLNRDPRTLEMPGTWGICCRKGQAWSSASPRQRLYVLQETAREAGLPRPFGFQMISSQAPDDKHEPVGFGVCPTGFWTYHFWLCSYVSFLELGVYFHAMVYWKGVASFLFHSRTQLRVCLGSQMRIGLWTVKHCWNC